jgi:hypothetical protein
MMQNFEDSTGASWGIEVDWSAARRIEKETGFQVLKLFLPTEVEKLANDPLLMVDVICACVAPQLSERGLESEQFLSRLPGDHMEAAVIALHDAVADFMPEAKKKAMLAIKDLNLREQAAAQDQVQENLELFERVQQAKRVATTEKLKQKLDQLQAEISATQSAGSCGTTPAS